MASPELLRAFMQQASSSGARSTVMQPVSWLIGILTSGCVLSTLTGAPSWLTVMLGSLLTLSVGSFLVGYTYFAIKNPDALRSEKYTLQKLAMEKNLIGDSQAGLISVEEEAAPTLIETPSAAIAKDKT